MNEMNACATIFTSKRKWEHVLGFVTAMLRGKKPSHIGLCLIHPNLISLDQPCISSYNFVPNVFTFNLHGSHASLGQQPFVVNLTHFIPSEQQLLG